MHPIEHPTYLKDIRFLFEEQDMQCMESRGVDLRTYQGVKDSALNIYFQVRDGNMPPQPSRRWPAEQVETFYNWMRDDYPRGVAPQTEDRLLTASGASRIRRNIADYEEGTEELATLRKAFEGIMALDTSDPSNPMGYFNLAGIHWFPAPLNCRHHEDAYNPWHRAYLQLFEDALRSIEGCEEVTLPYWDIASGEFPEVLTKPPFDKYTFPRDLLAPDGSVFAAAGSSTLRDDGPDILAELVNSDVPGDIAAALGAGRWEGFNGWPVYGAIIRAHDNGHVACGTTLAEQEWAAFDPLFWFFHCNWDRLWWRWQQAHSGTTVADFKTLVDGRVDWITDPILNGLKPFSYTVPKTIDIVAEMDADYLHPPGETVPAPVVPLVLSERSHKGLRIVDPDRILVSIDGINRLDIPGSFRITLTADGEPIATRAMFQPKSPRECATCRKQGVFSTAFEVDRHAVEGRQLAARLDLVRGKDGMTRFPLSRAGDPSLSVHVKTAH
ncbi:tyrosinase family protein [Tropicibacter sp. S64]|uniref:tyrosinase family protein n=1 Tax=Tropicibacter sp. S64 TaxID=3415122 RepID=UPI003C7C937F